MPFINGRYYMNPIFGAAVERARNAEADPQFNDEVFRHGTPEGALEVRDAFYRYDPYNEAEEPHFQLDAAQQHRASKRPVHHAPPAAKRDTPSQNANRVYNETSGLRPTTKFGPGSAQDLHDARLYIAHVLENREALGKLGIVAPTSSAPEMRLRSTPILPQRKPMATH